jgi:hypothetical protein
MNSVLPALRVVVLLVLGVGNVFAQPPGGVPWTDT